MDIWAETALLGAVYGAFATSYLLNALSGAAANCILRGERFDMKKFARPVWLVLLTAVVMGGLAAASGTFFYAAGLIAARYGGGIAEEIRHIAAGSVSAFAFLKLFLKGFIESWQKIYKNVRDWLDIRDTAEFSGDYEEALNRLNDPAERLPQNTEFSDGEG